MSEQYDESDEGHEPVRAEPVTSTGHPAVDAVLADLEGAEDQPPAEQVAAFERAHEQLRSALADAGNDQDPTR